MIDLSNNTLSTLDRHLNRISNNWMLTKANLHWMQNLEKVDQTYYELEGCRNCRESRQRKVHAHNLDENQKLLGIQNFKVFSYTIAVI